MSGDNDPSTKFQKENTIQSSTMNISPHDMVIKIYIYVPCKDGCEPLCPVMVADINIAISFSSYLRHKIYILGFTLMIRHCHNVTRLKTRTIIRVALSKWFVQTFDRPAWLDNIFTLSPNVFFPIGDCSCHILSLSKEIVGLCQSSGIFLFITYLVKIKAFLYDQYDRK